MSPTHLLTNTINFTQLNSKMLTKIKTPCRIDGRWTRVVSNNQSFIYGNLLLVDYYVDEFYFENDQYNASSYAYKTSISIGNIVCIDESTEDDYKCYPAAAFNDAVGQLTIGYLNGMEKRATVKNAHIVGAIPVVPNT